MTAVIRTGMMPVGGTPGQVLAKSSPADYDTAWTTPAGGATPASAVVADTTFGAVPIIGTGTNYARNDHSHGSPDHKDAQHSTIHLNALAPPTASIDMNGQRIINLLDPFASNEGATKNYVDQAVGSVSGGVPTSRKINTTAPLTGGGDLTADRTLAISAFSGSSPGAVPTSPGGTTNFLRADGTWASPPGSMLAQSIQTYPDYATRDTAVPNPAQGACCYITGTGEFQIYLGGTYGWRPPWKQPWGVVGTPVQVTAAQTGITTPRVDVTGLSQQWNILSGRMYRHTVNLAQCQQRTAIGTMQIFLIDGANQVRQLARFDNMAINEGKPVNLVWFNQVALTSATSTWKVQAATSAGTLDITMSTTQPGQYTIEDIGPVLNAPPN